MSGPMHSFSPRFSPDELKGYAASHHREREDLFQQLVGALLQLQYPNGAHVSATRGRDGSIDSYVDSGHNINGGLCADLAAPVIIECKDHEEGANTAKNILQGWANVEKKLRKQADNGWRGHFSPWLHSKSYLYCVSANITQNLREQLCGKIEKFFRTLPQESRPPIDHVRVVDWGDLRPHLNSSGKLIDAWLGINHSNIADHKGLLRGLSGFRSLLREEELRFIELDKNAPFNPHCIYERLKKLNAPRGTLLKGIGGIGKSRTAIEVATLAEKDGWRVLHILPGEPAVATEDIEELLAIDNGDTLLVFDYLEQATLDYQALAQRVLARAHGRGQRVRLLATARPNTLKPNHPRDQLFDTIEMAIDGDQQQRLSRMLVPLIAPNAISTLGLEPVLTACGHRPIIAVIIARDLERLAGENRLNFEQLGATPPGDLLARLRAQLDDHQLAANQTSIGGLLPDPPKPDLILAATSLAASPLNESELAETVSQAAGCDGAITRSQRIIAHLKTLGWLDTVGNALYSAHDVVADEMLQRVFWDVHAQSLHTEQFHQLLTPLLGSARLLGRFAITFSRVQGGPFREAVAVSSTQWLAQHVEALGAFWANAPADESAYAIGAALDYPEWAGQLVHHWDALLQPWLHRHGEELAARHLLYRGLKALPMKVGNPLVLSAEHWLTKHSRQAEASYILAPLLGRDDLGTHATATIELAMAWLNHEAHAPEAQFVLAPLLGRNDLGAHATAAIELAMAWLNHEAHAPEAQFVLAPLLGRDDLGTHATAAIELAMARLSHEEQAHAPEASYVLARLLGRDDLGAHTTAAIELAMAWLSHEERAHAPEASYFLARLLGRDDLGAHATAAIELAMAWLNHDEQARSADADFVLRSLLERKDLTKSQHTTVRIQAIHWLSLFPNGYSCSFIIKALLVDRQSNEGEVQVFNAVLIWLNTHHHDVDAEFVLKRLLRQHSLSDDQWRQTLDYAITWLNRYTTHDEYPHVLSDTLIRGDCLTEEQRKRLVSEAEAVLSTPSKSSQRTVDALRTRLEAVKSGKPLLDENQLSAELSRLACSSETLNGEVLQQGLDAVVQRLQRNSPASAGYFIPPLLALSHRVDNTKLLASILATAKQVVSHPKMRPNNFRGMKSNAIALLGKNEWPTTELGHADLKATGLLE